MPRKPIEAPAPDDEPVAAGGEEDVVEMNYTANFGDAENYEGVDMDDLAEFVDLGDEAEEEATAAATANTDGVELVTVRPLAKSLQLQPGGGVAQMDAEAADELPQVIERVAAHGTEMGLNKQERLGYIKEYIDPQSGLGMLYSNAGIVLFHLNMTWVDGKPVEDIASAVNGELQIGTRVNFVYCSLEGEEYANVNTDGNMSQAAAVWTGARPEKVLRTVDSPEHFAEMETYRQTFLELVDERKFLPLAIARLKGKITGYFSEHYGLLEFKLRETDKDHQLAVFHTRDAHVFGKKAYKMRDPIWKKVPAGLNIYFDAREMKKGFRGVKYHAITVFAGQWASVPHPTRFPGGSGSHTSCFDFIQGSTFYYMNVQLKSDLDREWAEFKRQSERQGAKMMDVLPIISTADDYFKWFNYYAPAPLKNRPRRDPDQKRPEKRNFHEFRRETFRPFKATKRLKVEFDTDDPNDPRIKREIEVKAERDV